MTDSDSKPGPPSGRIPRAALATVAIGLLLSVGIFAITHKGTSGLKWLTWDVVEPVKTQDSAKLGPKGSLRLARTSISAVAPNVSGYLIYQVAGIVSIEAGDQRATTLRCDVSTLSMGEESMIARTQRKRAAWPRPSEDLLRQEVPEVAAVKYHTMGTGNVGLPIRDSFRRYTDSAAPTLVDWDGYAKRTQNWVWTMPKGPGRGGAKLGYAVVFRTMDRPVSEVQCRARTAGAAGRPGNTAEVNLPVKLKEWPIQVEELDPATGADASDVG